MYSQSELEQLGFAKLGKNVLVSRKTSLYGIERISLGDFTRIDDFSILSAGENGIEIGKYVHIAAFCSLIGNGKITMADFSGLSSRVSVYSSNDDYSGRYLSNPTVDAEFTNVTSAPVTLEKHVIVGAAAIILPGVTIGEGCAIGSMALVTKSLESWGVFMGQPAKKIKNRSKKLLEKEVEFLASKAI